MGFLREGFRAHVGNPDLDWSKALSAQPLAVLGHSVSYGHASMLHVTDGGDYLEQSAQSPKISRVWLTSVKPCSAETLSAQRSTAGPSTSTVLPQARQTRW